MNPLVRRISITFLLAALCVSAFYLRLDAFQKTKLHTLDEVVYFHLGLQLKENITRYNTLDIKDWLTSDHSELPAYFYQPLFKHPPLFFYFLMMSYHILGEDPGSATCVSILFGVLMIPLTYLLGRLLFNQVVGIMAAIFVYMDPLSILCSQKVWMDSTLAFFMVLAVYLFLYGLKRQKDNFFIFSGVAAGLATLVKYPGILSTIAILGYVLWNDQSLLKNKKVLWGFVIPVLMLIPWVFWNYSVYGLTSFSEFALAHNLASTAGRIRYFFIGTLIMILFSLQLRNSSILSKVTKIWMELSLLRKVFTFGKIALIVFFFFYFRLHVFLSWQFDLLPPGSGYQGFFADAKRTFYIGKLLEFSFIYCFAYLGFFLSFSKENRSVALIKWAILIIFVFYSLWRGFQSRYILPAIPLLIILASDILHRIYNRVWAHPHFMIRLLGRIFLVISILMIVSRSYYVDTSFSKDVCYF